MKGLVQFILFTSLFITGVAIVMSWHTMDVLSIPKDSVLLRIIAFSTLTSYNLHWYLTNDLESSRVQNFWILQHKKTHLIIVIVAGVLLLRELCIHPHYIVPLIPAAIASSLYTLPKIPRAPFTYLKKWAIAKTLYLALVWTYVTSILVFVSHPHPISSTEIWYFLNQFCYIYSICILFDYKDIAADLKAGIPSIFHHFGEVTAFRIFYVVILIGIYASAQLPEKNLVLIHIVPYIAILWSKCMLSKKMNDYFYYGWLDGCMMAAFILSVIQKL